MLVTTQCILLTDANFQSEVLEAQVPVLVDCWASWCGSFHQMNPIIETLAIEFAGQIKIGRLNIAASEQLAMRYDIRAVPTLLLFKDGQVMERVIGSVSKQRFADTLNALLPGSYSSRSRMACL
ncbi:thioredoxin family protein [Stenomitos frigidus]|uniref:Thioredoxin n=1 Tax=Stenomitos frigidus ULC18 TaxID=2107698 RepID=A0A2T1DV10_9CYAN|nr:thioredoxin domain-containing protein [Stenomitos frigidus]PSB24320.1 thiol reductase thioredoxin [Stenomitos frigidus ULC18]